MKKTILASFLITALTITSSSNAQVGIGVSTANINPSAQLEVSSTSKGFLPPRMTEVQKNAIISPASGLLVYQTDGVSGYYYFDGAVWKSTLGPQGPTGPAGLSATSTMAEASTTGSSGTYLLNPSPNNVYINVGSWISIGTNNTSSYYYVSGKGNDNTITILNTGGTLASWPVNATVALVGRIGAAGVAGPAGPLVTSSMASSGSLPFFGSSGTFALTPSSNNVYINAGSYISIGTNNTSQYFYVSNKLDDNTITIAKTSMDAGFSWPVNATVALVGPLGPNGLQGEAGIDGSDATISVGAIGNATTNGATITEGVLSLAPADESNGGIVTTDAQNFAGDKTFNNNIVANGIVGVGTASPSASAKLEVNSTSQGFLPPRMTEAQRDAIFEPVQGLMLYCTDCGANGEPEYYNGRAWVNLIGAPATKSLVVGKAYQGGIIAYILQSNDPGYDAGEIHGLIAATEDQSLGIQWGPSSTTGATGTEIGDGLSNTNTIIASQGDDATNYAAGVARAYNGGGYTDWYLPSREELIRLCEYIGQAAAAPLTNVGGFADGVYWTSSEAGYFNAWRRTFATITTQGTSSKATTCYVRAVRAF